MSYTAVSSLALLLLAAECSFGQIIYPGGYPGQYPSGGGIPLPFPGGRRTRTNPDNQPTQNFTGLVRKLSTSEIDIEDDDRRVVAISLFSSTRYFKTQSDADNSTPRSSGTARRTDIQVGDEVSVDAAQDDSGNYRAVKVAMIKPNAADDRSRTSSSSSDTGDDDRPRLKRANPPDSGNGSAASNSTSGSAQPTTPPSRGSATSVTPPSPPLDADDAGQPTLQRRRPSSTNAASSSSTDSGPATVADSRPSLHAEDVNGVTRVPDAPQAIDNGPDVPRRGYARVSDEDPIISQAREEAFSFSETLPNYVVKQYTTRYATTAARGGRTSWQAIDTVTADVVSEGGKESYKNVLVNRRPPREAVERTGAWSTGEFASFQQDILSTDTDADFHNKRSTTIVNRPAYRYDFSVEQRNSHWDVHANSESYSPAYSGTIWIDKATSRVLRIEIAAEKIPRSFPLDTVESAVDYDYVLIGEMKYLLPAHSEALSCRRGTGDCSRNVIDFRNYKKFTAETSISFGDDH